MCRRDGDLGVDLENWQDGGIEDEDELKCFWRRREGSFLFGRETWKKSLTATDGAFFSERRRLTQAVKACQASRV